VRSREQDMSYAEREVTGYVSDGLRCQDIQRISCSGCLEMERNSEAPIHTISKGYKECCRYTAI